MPHEDEGRYPNTPIPWWQTNSLQNFKTLSVCVSFKPPIYGTVMAALACWEWCKTGAGLTAVGDQLKESAGWATVGEQEMQAARSKWWQEWGAGDDGSQRHHRSGADTCADGLGEAEEKILRLVLPGTQICGVLAINVTACGEFQATTQAVVGLPPPDLTSSS
jgi:hypothetical protein